MIFGRSVTQIFFFQEICFSGGKQTIHKVSADFIVKNCHPRTSLINGICGTFDIKSNYFGPVVPIKALKSFEKLDKMAIKCEKGVFYK